MTLPTTAPASVATRMVASAERRARAMSPGDRSTAGSGAGGPQGDEAVDITVADVAERAAQAGLAM
ncbi:hypothetical protein D3874_03620 [Oleomonas cavernae]|uniref:Uncharacterized protein n=1 Tax=Oleomonas cavernae TaxID=2320859 RepID=A0A418WUJ8_9PROT|nr:hypothetical protein D3874_03620 [Oleomonas cavernae]